MLPPIEIHRYQHPEWLTNCYLLVAPHSQAAVMIDAGAPVEAFMSLLEHRAITLEAILLTHTHHDHTACLSEWLMRCSPRVFASRETPLPLSQTVSMVADGEELHIRGIQIRAFSTPGHAADHLSFLVNDDLLFTGDIIFKDSVGGTSNGDFSKLRNSVISLLAQVPHSARILPGHAEESSVGHEWNHNPFVLAWRGMIPLSDIPCEVRGIPGRLRLITRDYDGEGKAWVQLAHRDAVLSESEIHY